MKIYLMRDDGALTGAIAFNEKYKIDKLTPEASKTGTITKGEFAVSRIRPVGVSEAELLETATVEEYDVPKCGRWKQITFRNAKFSWQD